MILTKVCFYLLFLRYTLEIYNKRHPVEQKPFDPKKRTVVVLGSGWGAISFLKSINTDDYNVVCTAVQRWHLQKQDWNNVRSSHRSQKGYGLLTSQLFQHSTHRWSCLLATTSCSRPCCPAAQSAPLSYDPSWSLSASSPATRAAMSSFTRVNVRISIPRARPSASLVKWDFQFFIESAAWRTQRYRSVATRRSVF